MWMHRRAKCEVGMTFSYEDTVPSSVVPFVLPAMPASDIHSRPICLHAKEAGRRARTCQATNHCPQRWEGSQNRNSSGQLAVLKDHRFDDARRMSSGNCSPSCTASGIHPPSLPLLCLDPVLNTI
eukprot:scaffold11632_cov108-Cylindrotheca_fusiformis.AAC.1